MILSQDADARTKTLLPKIRHDASRQRTEQGLKGVREWGRGGPAPSARPSQPSSSSMMRRFPFSVFGFFFFRRSFFSPAPPDASSCGNQIRPSCGGAVCRDHPLPLRITNEGGRREGIKLTKLAEVLGGDGAGAGGEGPWASKEEPGWNDLPPLHTSSGMPPSASASRSFPPWACPPSESRPAFPCRLAGDCCPSLASPCSKYARA